MIGFVFVLLMLCVSSTSHSQLVDWRLQSSAKVGTNGAKISILSYNDSSWFNVTVPSTTLNGLLQNNVYSDPYYSLNLQNIPTEQFNVPWWYRTEFITNAHMENTTVLLKLCGINYAVNVWVNGKLVADNNTIIGTLVEFNINITSYISTTTIFNAVAIEIYKPINGWTSSYKTSTDLAISYVDWNPYAPDSSMGIWKPVYLDIINISPNIQLQYPQVNSTVDSSVANMNDVTNPTNANLTIMIEVNNFENYIVTETLTVSISNIGNIQQKMTLPANSMNNKIYFSYKDYPMLQLKNKAYLWWPYQFLSKMKGEKPFLYNITFSVADNAIYSTKFGIRQSTSELITDHNFLLFKINHKPLLISGGGYSTNLVYNFNESYVRSEMEYMQHMGLNTMRLEGKWPRKFFYDLADEYGILIQPGFECCDSWQHWSYWTNKTIQIASNSLRSQIKKLRIHPSVFSFFASSDQLPPKDIEQTYFNIFNEENWMNPVIQSAANTTSSISGPSGVKMSGPYAWVPPVYWLQSTPDGPLLDGQGLGGAFGYLTEGGPGANPMSYESLSITIPSNEMWPINNYWNWHCGNQNGLFGNLNHFTPPLNARYGSSLSAKEYTYKASVASYESHRAMYEGYARNKYISSTGVINWMLNNAFPSNMWNLYDYYLNVNGGFFGTRKALKYRYGYHLMLTYTDWSVWMITSHDSEEDYNGNSLIAIARVRDILNGGTIESQHNMTINTNNISKDSSINLFTFQNNMNNLKIWIVQLLLIDEISGMEIDENIYWISSKMDVLDWSASNFYVTPCSKYADFSSLSGLKSVALSSNHNTTVVDRNGEPYYHTSIKIANPSLNTVAFMIQARIIKSGNEMSIITPILWSDNLITIFPMESKTINATYPVVSMNGAIPDVVLQSYNDL